MSQEAGELARAILGWSRKRPAWEHHALGMIALAQPMTDDAINLLADMAIDEAAGRPVHATGPDLETLAPGNSSNGAVRLRSIGQPNSVNALNWADGLTFAPEGVTVVYGENGSGKSGYARVLKKVTRSRSETDVLSNVFESPSDQSAVLSVTVGDADAEDLSWPLERPTFLSRVSFFDSDCSTRYVSTETEVAYRPSAIAVLDTLTSVSGKVRQELEDRKSVVATETPVLPDVPRDTRAYQFLQNLTAETSDLDIDLACELPSDTEDRLVALTQRIANLSSDDVPKRRSRLQKLDTAATSLMQRIEQMRTELSDSHVAELHVSRAEASEARMAADAASSRQFEALPVGGVGSEAWRALWNAARRFSETEAYFGRQFPYLGDEHEDGSCVLCHQSLEEDAKRRLESFESFVANDTERLAAEAVRRFETLASALGEQSQTQTSTELWLQEVQQSDDRAHDEMRSALVDLETRRKRIVESLTDDSIKIEALPEPTLWPHTVAMVDEAKKMLSDLEAANPSTQLAELQQQKSELVGRQALGSAREQIHRTISHQRQVQTIDKATRLTSTNGITRQAAELTRTHVSDVLKHHFSQETLRLGLERVRLADAGGGQGNLRHRAQLVDAIQRAPLGDVLSEGEQTAIALAGFLTEVESDASGSAVVFDDPVTSLDHVRQERVARRIVELASKRQVIIFTHDVGFVVDLKRAAEAMNVAVTEKWVTKLQADVGRVSEGGPWDSKTVGQRAAELRSRLGELKTVYGNGDPAETQEAIRSWYADLRLVWERALEEVVLGPVQVRGRLELRPGYMKVFVRFDESDDREFQTAFTMCGDRGSHDRSTQLNRPMSQLAELHKDLDDLQAWHKRVKAYAK